MARYPVPPDLLEAIDKDHAPRYGPVHMARRQANRKVIAEVSERINAIYDSGVPFFTKDAIRAIAKQVDDSTAGLTLGDKASLTFKVQGLDGIAVDIPLELGTIQPNCPEDDPDLLVVAAKVKVQFSPVDHLTSECTYCADRFERSYAFLPIIVERHWVQLHKDTRKYVPHYPIFPLETVRSTFQQKRVELETSDLAQQLLSTLGSANIPNVNKIIALACFNLSDCEMAERSSAQHALVCLLRTFFAQRQGMDEDKILCFAQDPLYEDEDRTVLAEVGISVLENPLAFLEVDDASVVFSLGPLVPVRQIVADIALPAMMIWDRVEEIERPWKGLGLAEKSWIGYAEQSDNISPRVTEMVNRHYTELQFPEDNQRFGRSAIYVRRSDSVETDRMGQDK